MSSLIALNATSGLRSRLVAAVAATDASRANSSTTRTLSSADTLAATCGRLRKSVVTAAATSSSRASEWIAVTFSCGVIRVSTSCPTRRLASSVIHRALPSGGFWTAANRSASSSMFARARWTV